MKVMFLDESGDHSLEVIDPQYPVFVLAGVIMDAEYAKGEADRAMRAFKREMFGREDIILHTADITRNRGAFEQMKQPAFRSRFYARLNDLMRRLEYKVVACVIRKEDHLQRYGLAAMDPYMLSLHVLVERFCYEIGDVADGGLIVAEKRNPTLDHALEIAFLDLKVRGTPFLQAVEIEKRIAGLRLRAKRENITGLQIADLVASPIGRHVLGKVEREDYAIVRQEYRRNRWGEYRGYGLVVLPR